MKKCFLGLMMLSSVTTFASELCLNQVGDAAFRFAGQNLQTKSERLFDNISSAVSVVKNTGGVMNDTIYHVKLSGRRVSSSGMSVGPASFDVVVYIDNSTCKISRINQM